MALRKRKSKLTELFPEREALRVRPIKPKPKTKLLSIQKKIK